MTAACLQVGQRDIDINIFHQTAAYLRDHRAGSGMVGVDKGNILYCGLIHTRCAECFTKKAATETIFSRGGKIIDRVSAAVKSA